MCAEIKVSACGGSGAPHCVAPLALRLSPTREEQWLRPYPSPPVAAPRPSPTRGRRFAATWQVYRLRTFVLRAMPVLSHIGNCQVAAKRRPPSPTDEASPPRLGPGALRQVFDRAVAPRTAGAPECTWRRIQNRADRCVRVMTCRRRLRMNIGPWWVSHPFTGAYSS